MKTGSPQIELVDPAPSSSWPFSAASKAAATSSAGAAEPGSGARRTASWRSLQRGYAPGFSEKGFDPPAERAPPPLSQGFTILFN